ncbi:hypothetical protein H0H92_001392 [Tricholoma furcatifolium]|nr:hypothetical protein H0H92_001392 [Tricholoma furcatifolium]
MPGREWATADQSAFLLGDLQRYRECQADQSYRGFWDYMFEAWEKKFPERLALFPDLAITDSLNAEQEQSLTEAIQKCQQQIVSWYRWRTQKKARKAEAKKMKKLVKIIHGTRSRLPQVTEIYSDMFYEAKIAPLVKMETPPDATRSERLTVIKRVTRELWIAETSEVVNLVNARLVELKAEKARKLENPPELPDAQEIAENLDNLPAVMGRFLEYMESVTGWSFSCLMGGPDPEQDGKIRVASYHVGKTPLGKCFNDVFLKFDSAIMSPYTDFLHVIHPDALDVVMTTPGSSTGTDNKPGPKDPAMDQLAKKLIESSAVDSLAVLVNAAANAPPVPISVTDLPNSMPVPLVSPVSADVTTPSVTPATPILSPPLDPSDATLEPPNAVPASGAAPVVADDASLMGASVSIQEVQHVATPATNDAGPPNAEPASSAVANSTSGISYWPPVNTGSWIDTGNLMSSLYSRPTGHSADNFETPPLSNNFDLFGKFDFGLGFNFDAGLIPQHNDLLDPALSPPSFSGPHSSLPSLLSCSADGRGLSTNGMSTSTDASQSSPQLPPSVQLSTDVIEPLNSSIHSRSGRTITPSTCNDQLNKIGSNPDPVKAPGKENFPVGVTVPPDWMVAACNYLMAQDLGESWKQLVAAWERFEELLDYHCGKGLPGAKERPEEWSQWVSEKYSTEGSAELSCNYAGASDALPRQRGRHVGFPTQRWPEWNVGHYDPAGLWQEDSQGLWKECVDDVRACFEAMETTPGAVLSRGRKRTSSAVKGSKSKRTKAA